MRSLLAIFPYEHLNKLGLLGVALLAGLSLSFAACDDDDDHGGTVYIENGVLVNLPPGGRVFTQSLSTGDFASANGNIRDDLDADGYTFSISEAGRADITVETTSSLNPFVELYDGNGGVFLLADDDSGFANDALIAVNLSPGTYHVVVWSSLDGPFSGNYRLEIALLADENGGSANFDNGMLVSTPPGGESLPANVFPFQTPYSVQRTIFDEFDADGYPFTVDTASRIVISMESLDTLNPFLELYDSTGSLVVDNDDGGVGSDALLVVDLDPGDYTVVCWSSLDGPFSGDYQLDIQPVTQAGIDFDVVAVGTMLTEVDQELFDGDDALAYIFSITNPATVDFEAMQQAGGGADVALELFDQRGSSLFFEDPAGVEDPSQSGVSLDRGTYILIVSNAAPATGGLFDLVIDVRP